MNVAAIGGIMKPLIQQSGDRFQAHALPMRPLASTCCQLVCALYLTCALAPAADKKSASKDSGETRNAASTAVSGEHAKVGEKLKEAFDDGFVIGPKRLQEAAKLLVQARKLAPDEPRVDYAHGLVLLKQSQNKPAVVQFEAAIKHDGGPFWPAWKAAIWSHFVEKQYEPGLKRLVEFARHVREAAPGEPTAAQRDAAHWIGQILEALTIIPDAKKHKGSIAEHQAQTLDALGDSLSLAVEEGRELLRARAVELGIAAAASRDTAEQIDKRRKQDQSDKLDKDLEGVDKAKEEAAKSKDDWKKWLDDALPQFDKQLGQLDKDYLALQQRGAALEQQYIQAGTRLTAINANLSLLNPRNTDPITLGNLREQALVMQNQMLAYQVEYNLNLERVSNLAQRAAGVADQRATAIGRYEQATGDLLKKNSDLDKWSTRLKDKKQKLTAKPGKGSKKDVDKKLPASMKTLMPLDLERERDEVLAAFGIQPPAADAEKPAASVSDTGDGK